MPEETSIETPEPVVEDVKFEMDCKGVPLPFLETAHKKGPSKGELQILLDVDFNKTSKIEMPEAFCLTLRAVGPENFWPCLYRDCIRKICNDATHASIDPDTGKSSEVGFTQAYYEGFLPARLQKGGAKKSELLEKQREIMAEMQPLMIVEINKSRPLTDEEKAKMLSLLADYGDINEKLEKKSRKGVKAKKAA